MSSVPPPTSRHEPSKRFRPITPRTLRAQLPPSPGRDWVGGDPFLSAYFEALSLVFPPGERFFMESVRVLRQHVEDPELAEAVRGFLAQEALHSREHHTLNVWLAQHGIAAQAIMRNVEAEIARRAAQRSPLENLAVTCALEHFTALMADSWLRDRKLQAEMPPAMRALWTWHAIEEIEHKAVAFDVYQAAGGDYATRVRWMARITVAFVLGTAVMQANLLAMRGELRPSWYVLRGLVHFWGPRGMLTRLIPQYLRYYLPTFHPAQHDQSALQQRFDAELRDQGYAAPRG